jgi:hypothetical protein
VTAGPGGPDRAARRRRREALRRAHPDLGGDPAELARLLRPPAPAGDEVRFVSRPRGLARVPAWCRARLGRRSRPRRVR